jgi:superkiller protein 3
VWFSKKQKHLPESVVAFEKAINLAPKLALAHYNLANALVLESHLDDAENEYQAAVSADPDFSGA